MIRAGELRHRVTIEKQKDLQGTRGERLDNWEKVTEVWAEIVTLAGNKLQIAQQNFPTATHQIRIRYCPLLKTEHRIKHRDKLYYIDSIDNVEQRNAEMILICNTEP